MIHSYPSIFNLGHKAIQDLFLDTVVIEEKIDGSQFSFGLVRTNYQNVPGWELQCRSKNEIISDLNNPPKMFKPAVEAVLAVQGQLVPGWTYRGEFLAKPHHNTLQYARIPQNHIILFDVDAGIENYLPVHTECADFGDTLPKTEEAIRVGFECVPILFYGKISNPAEVIPELLERESILGGTQIEGVVIKNYHRFGVDKKVLMGKYVSERFKEIHSAAWKKNNPSGKDIIGNIILELKTEARWLKAMYALRDAGVLQSDPRDIGQLIKTVQNDIEKECIDHITSRLLSHARPHILRGAIGGLAEWYKKELLKQQKGSQ